MLSFVILSLRSHLRQVTCLKLKVKIAYMLSVCLTSISDKLEYIFTLEEAGHSFAQSRSVNIQGRNDQWHISANCKHEEHSWQGGSDRWKALLLLDSLNSGRRAIFSSAMGSVLGRELSLRGITR